ncbi:MAG: TonB-dependent receptor, partial [Bacteroidota bacterium]
RIEVVKGPGSALYGGGALGGVVNVITKDAPETPETSVRAFAGAYQPARYEVWYETWPEGDAYRPFFGTSITHARKVSPTLGGWVQLGYQRDDGYLNFNEFDLSQLYAKVDWRPQPTLKVGLLAGVLNRTKDTFLFWNGSRDALQPGNVVLAGSRDGPPSGTTDNNTLQLSLWPTLTHVLAPDLFYSVRLRAFAALIRPISDETGEVRRFADGTVGVRYGGEWQLDWAPKASRQLTFGVSGDALLTRSSLFRTGDDDEQGSQPEGAVFAQWDEQVTERIAVVAGLRFDGYAIDASDTVTRLSPKLSGSYVLNEAVTLRAGFGQGFRVPSLAERFADDRSFFPIVRNPGLQPERSSSVEAGVRATLPFGGGAGLQTDVALFWNDYWDLIEPAIKPEASAFQFVNLTRARIRGVEIGLDAFTPAGDRTLHLGYTLMRSDDLTLSQELSFRPRHLLKAGIDGQLVGPFRAGADYRFASRPQRVDSDFVRFVPNADVLVAQHFVDFRLSVDWSRLRVTAHARNAFDYYALERPAFLGAPRHYEVQMQWDF